MPEGLRIWTGLYYVAQRIRTQYDLSPKPRHRKLAKPSQCFILSTPRCYPSGVALFYLNSSCRSTNTAFAIRWPKDHNLHGVVSTNDVAPSKPPVPAVAVAHL